MDDQQLPEDQLDRDMWFGYTDFPYRDDEIPFLGRNLFDVGTFQPMPPSAVPYPSVFVRAEPVPWQAPNWWSQPFDYSDAVCIPWYETDTPVLQYTVGPTSLTVVTGVSYEFPQGALNNDDIFVVRLLRNGMEMARWEDYVVNAAAANPNDRLFFSSHITPIPIFNARFDHNDHITVTIRVRGPIPFPFGPADPLNVEFKVLLEGWNSWQRDTRDGAPKYLTDGDRFNERVIQQAEQDSKRIHQFVLQEEDSAQA